MNTVKVRNLELGSGIPAICIPNVGKTKDEILSLARQYVSMPMDMMEWRVDWFEDCTDAAKTAEVIEGLREILGEIPLLFTFRTANEGGVRPLDTEAYKTMTINAAKTGLVDLVDVEIFTGDEIVRTMIDAAHESGVKVIASNHDFDGTPAKSDLIYRLRKMQDMGADVAKIAVMPKTKRDVVTLLAATEEMATDYATGPIITMSMAGTGSISRLACEVFGSCLTFGSGSMASAPGQISATELHSLLTSIHNALGQA